MVGAFQTSREIFNHPVWKNIVEFRLFFLIYGNAIFAEEGYKVADDLHLKRGQWLRSTRKLQEDLEYIDNRRIMRYSTSTLHRAIKSLSHVEVQMLCTKTHELGTVFTVVNYEEYQGLDSYKKSELGTELGTVTEQWQNNNKKDNKDIKDIAQFDQFWNIYPSKKGRIKALQKWLTFKNIDLEKVISGTTAYIKFCEATDRTYRDGSTFVNNQSWNDDWTIPLKYKHTNKIIPLLDIIVPTQEERDLLDRNYIAQQQRNRGT